MTSTTETTTRGLTLLERRLNMTMASVGSITVTVPSERVYSVLLNGLDQCHHLSYWLRVEVRDQRPIRLHETEDGGGKTLSSTTLNGENLQRGVQAMATKASKHFGDMLAETDDIDTADVLLQMICFGEVRYG